MDELIRDLEFYYEIKINESDKEKYIKKWLEEDLLTPRDVFAIFEYSISFNNHTSFAYMDVLVKAYSKSPKEIKRREISEKYLKDNDFMKKLFKH